MSAQCKVHQNDLLNMNSRQAQIAKFHSTLRSILSSVPDTNVAAILEESNDLTVSLAALGELLRNASTREKVLTFESDILELIDLFLCEILENTNLSGDSAEDLKRALFIAYGRQKGWIKKEPSVAAWPWPILHISKGKGAIDGAFRPESALRMFGYTVGKTNGWPRQKRHKFLTDFMEKSLPSVVEREFGDEYGEPLTTTRLRKVAHVISSNCSLRMRNDPRKYAKAISDWKEDLDFLKREYYDCRGLKFVPWPDPRT